SSRRAARRRISASISRFHSRAMRLLSRSIEAIRIHDRRTGGSTRSYHARRSDAVSLGRLTAAARTGLCWLAAAIEGIMPLHNTDPALLPAHVMSAEIAARRLSPIDLVDAALARIGSQDAKLHAFVEVYDKEARLAAEAADKAIRSGHR